jgi:hypothetical protein
MSGLTEGDAVQGIGPGPRGQRLDHGTGQLLDQLVEHVSTLDAFGQGGRPGQEGSFARVTRPPGSAEKGLPHR